MVCCSSCENASSSATTPPDPPVGVVSGCGGFECPSEDLAATFGSTKLPNPGVSSYCDCRSRRRTQEDTMLNILVCDDNSGWRDDLCEWITSVIPSEQSTVQVTRCAGYTEARRLLENGTWHLLVTDICGLTTAPGASLPEKDRKGSVLADRK